MQFEDEVSEVKPATKIIMLLNCEEDWLNTDISFSFNVELLMLNLQNIEEVILSVWSQTVTEQTM